MFEDESSTFTYQLLMRAFTLSNLYFYTEETFTYDNQMFIGEYIIITFNNE